MEAFSRTAPQWTQDAIHSMDFHCPKCDATSREAQKVWLNRWAPVTIQGQTRKWQEFYLCKCNQAWWGWSNDRLLEK